MMQLSFYAYCCGIFMELQIKRPLDNVSCPNCRLSAAVKEVRLDERMIIIKEKKGVNIND